jgi:hypothetical protein
MDLPAFHRSTFRQPQAGAQPFAAGLTKLLQNDNATCTLSVYA